MSHINQTHDPSNEYPEDGVYFAKRTAFELKQLNMVSKALGLSEAQKQYEIENPDPDWDVKYGF